MAITVPSKWIIGLDKDEAEKFVNLLTNNSQLIGRIVDVLEATLRSLEDAETDEKNFLAPDFPYRQAYLLGRKKELKQILKLFDFKTKESK